MKEIWGAVGVVVFVYVFCAACGCTTGEEGTEMTLVVIPAEPTSTPVPTADNLAGDEGWTVWREGSIAIGRLGEYQAYRPMKNGEYFRSLRVGVDASEPVSVFFFTPDELVNFQTKMMTNAGNYSAVAVYEDVTSGTYTCVGDRPLTVAVLNTGNRPVTTAANIWYHE